MKKVVKESLIKVTETVFGTAHLVTAIAGETIALGEAMLLHKYRELCDEDGVCSLRTVKENVQYRKYRSMEHRRELHKFVTNPAKVLEELKMKYNNSKSTVKPC